MVTKWYYAENGRKGGPSTTEEIVKLLEREDARPTMIWAEGMVIAPLATHEETRNEAESKRAKLARRARAELIEYLAIAGYLAVWFGAVLFYKAAILESAGIDTTRLGLAIVKALILGKFMLVLQSLKVGESKKGSVLAFDILKKALLFTLLLFLLTIAEDAIVDYFHGGNVRDAVKEAGGGTRLQAIATAILMFMVLIPYFAYRDIAAKLGEGMLRRFLFAREPTQKVAGN